MDKLVRPYSFRVGQLLCRGRAVYWSRRFGVNALSRHMSLDQFAQELLFGLSSSTAAKRANIILYCGVHENFSLLWNCPGLRVAIQTEQFSDQSGRSLWASKNRNFVRNIFSAFERCDIFWDLNYNNAAFYETIKLPEPLFRKIVLGPYVFPAFVPSFERRGSDEVLFFGSINERRMEYIKSIKGMKVRMMRKTLHFQELEAEIRGSAGVLNVHFANGIYSEVPRVLTTLLAGKALFSEPLGPPFRESLHFINPLSERHIEAETVFRGMRDLARRFEFEQFLTERIADN
jgi:hypothetical protein